MKLFGLELELFYKVDDQIEVPIKGLPVDGFAGLVEIRSIVSKDPYECYGDVVQKRLALEDKFDCELALIAQHKFSSDQLREIRKNTDAPRKDRKAEINNLYGKKARLLPGGVALASLQVNISNQIRKGYSGNVGAPHTSVQVTYPDQFGALDVPILVRKLDERFGPRFIDEAKRTRGWYAIKDDIRLEYRSLPNFAFTEELPLFLSRL
jgi:hypothetical protein